MCLVQINTALVFQGPQNLLAGDPDLRRGVAAALKKFYGEAEVRDMDLICTCRPGGGTGFDAYFVVAPTAQHTTIQELKEALAEDPCAVFPPHFLNAYGVPVLKMTSTYSFYFVLHWDCRLTLLLLLLFLFIQALFALFLYCFERAFLPGFHSVRRGTVDIGSGGCRGPLCPRHHLCLNPQHPPLSRGGCCTWSFTPPRVRGDSSNN